MENVADLLMLRGVAAWCEDCAGERIFVPVADDCAGDGCEFCCTVCDAAVFLLPTLGPTGRSARHVA